MQKLISRSLVSVAGNGMQPSPYAPHVVPFQASLTPMAVGPGRVASGRFQIEAPNEAQVLNIVYIDS